MYRHPHRSMSSYTYQSDARRSCTGFLHSNHRLLVFSTNYHDFHYYVDEMTICDIHVLLHEQKVH
jgi:hypothetical protein